MSIQLTNIKLFPHPEAVSATLEEQRKLRIQVADHLIRIQAELDEMLTELKTQKD